MNTFQLMASHAGGQIAVGHLLIDRAAWVHRRLGAADRLNLSLSEETLTESLLLDLCTKLPDNILATPYTRFEESHRTGADWEWWFGDGPDTSWFGMRVQAKKLKRLRAGSYGYDFAYEPKTKGVPKTRQVDRLIAAAQRAGLPAVYALYNGAHLDLGLFPWGCCSFGPSKDLLGVGLLAATAAQAVANSGQMDQASTGGLSRPWSCAALCPNYLRSEVQASYGPEGPLPMTGLSLFALDLVADLYARAAQVIEESPRRQVSEALQGLRSWSATPPYVREMVSVPLRGRESSFRLEELLPEDLGGALILFSSRT